MFTDKKIGFIGAGQMATALAKGFLKNAGMAVENLLASDAVEESCERFTQMTGIRTVAENREVVEGCDVIVLAVKPQILPGVMAEIRPWLRPNHLILSIAAGISLASLAAGLGEGRRMIRVMPNTPCLIGEGAIAFCVTDDVTDADLELVKKLLKSVGRCFIVNESAMDAITGLSGSGPAYVYLIIEALSDAGVMQGLPRDVATTLAAQTVRGAAGMVLESREHPGVLKDRVTSPGGTTIAGMKQLEIHGVRGALYEAVEAATRRSRELGAK